MSFILRFLRLFAANPIPGFRIILTLVPKLHLGTSHFRWVLRVGGAAEIIGACEVQLRGKGRSQVQLGNEGG